MQFDHTFSAMPPASMSDDWRAPVLWNLEVAFDCPKCGKITMAEERHEQDGHRCRCVRRGVACISRKPRVHLTSFPDLFDGSVADSDLRDILTHLSSGFHLDWFLPTVQPADFIRKRLIDVSYLRRRPNNGFSYLIDRWISGIQPQNVHLVAPESVS